MIIVSTKVYVEYFNKNFFMIYILNELFIGYNTLTYEGGEKVETKLLIKRAKRGDKEALLQLVMLRKEEYYKLAYVYMKNEDDAMDAMQDMIVILYDNISKLRKDESFYSWSKTILVNECKSKLKNKKKILSLEDIEEPTVYEIYGSTEERMVLEEYLSQLSEKHQEVIKLRFFLDLDYESISEILKIPIGTVKSRISIGMEKLRESMRGGKIEKY